MRKSGSLAQSSKRPTMMLGASNENAVYRRSFENLSGAIMISKFEIDHLLNTVEAIARSPDVSEYVIGYTSVAPHIRFGQYRGRGYHHLVVLATQMIREDALDLEGHLQQRVKSNKDHILYKKYRAKKRDRPHARSAGGKSLNADSLGHSVYMAWIETPSADGNAGSTIVNVTS